MKKLFSVAVVMALLGGAAFAASISVPFFADMGPVYAETFIGLVNMTDVDIPCRIYYSQTTWDDTSEVVVVTDATPDPNSFIIQSGAAVAFRPGANVPAAETEAGARVPDMDLSKTLTGAAYGTAIVQWNMVNSAADIVGRAVQSSVDSDKEHAYLLPQGVATVQ